MKPRHIATALAIAIFALFTVDASDFWVSKDWKQWSKGECESLLAESPWAHIWRGGGPEGDQLAYVVQLRTALPIREAVVRQLQLDQRYDKMTDAERAAFDTKAMPILSRNHDDIILIHVDYSKGLAARYLQTALDSPHSGANTFTVSLATADGNKVSPIRVDMKANYAFDIIFPRMKDGLPVITDVHRHFSVQFQSPQVANPNQSITIPAKLVGVEFDPDKMVIDGKLSY